MNRPRNKGNKDLPQGLYVNKAGYFSYQHPMTKKYHGMGRNRRDAISAANRLNEMLMIEHSLVDKVIGRSNSMAAWLDKYHSVRKSEDDMSPKTANQLRYDIKLMSDYFGAIPVSELTVFHCSEFLDQWLTAGKRRMASRMRGQLIKCISYAESYGLIDNNPAEKTLPIDVKVSRNRLTKREFDEIYKLASKPVQNAMMLALITLQRREDIASMKFRDIKDGYLYVAQKKTAKGKGKRKDATNKAAHLMISVTPQLQAIIDDCRKTGVVSHHLVHHIHGRKSAGATHTEVKAGMPLQPDNITRGFASARKRTKKFDKVPARQRPTFHEIRSLGASLYKEQGIDPQALLGHTDAKMTKHYLDGHGIEWTMVEAGLNV